VTVHQCLNGCTPPYLLEHCIPVSSANTRWHLHSANRHLLAIPRFWLNIYGRSSQLPARWPGTHSRILSRIQRAAQTVLGVYLKRTCLCVTSISSELGVLTIMRYTNPHTHLTRWLNKSDGKKKCPPPPMAVWRGHIVLPFRPLECRTSRIRQHVPGCQRAMQLLLTTGCADRDNLSICY